MKTAVKVENIERFYGDTHALKKISFEVREGELFGFIGPDGAGKTSLFRILTTVLLPDSGKAEVIGFDVVKDYKQIRKRVGYMPGRFSLYQDLTVEENINFFATIFGTSIEENYDLVKDIYSHIEPFKKRRAGALSGGMKQKLALSCALIHRPDILFLDEPTTGVDPVSRKEFWEMLTRLRDQGITILVSTPYMDEAVLCDRVALIQEGKIMNIDTPQNVTEQFSKTLVAFKSKEKYKLLNALRKYENAASVYPSGEHIHYTDARGKIGHGELHEIVENMRKNGFDDVSAQIHTPTIEDRFMELMQQK